MAASPLRWLVEEKPESLYIEGASQRKISPQDFCEVMEPRIEEIFQLLHKELQKSTWFKQIGAGTVLTGGGSQLKELVERCEFSFDMPVRSGHSLHNKWSNRCGAIAQICHRGWVFLNPKQGVSTQKTHSLKTWMQTFREKVKNIF